MIYTSAVSLAGRYHAERGMNSQDRYSAVSGNDCSAAVLCDGAGSFAAGELAAELVSGTLAEFLCRSFEECFAEKQDVLLRRLVMIVEDTLNVCAREKGLDPGEMACTILAAVMHEDGRCLCLHLGDGMILRRRQHGNGLELVSRPANGIDSSSTYLTMNCSLFEHLRLFRWKQEDIEGIFLLTDGSDTPEMTERPADDCTCVSLIRSSRIVLIPQRAEQES
ncbi:MAG: protein phosphatase 2C domain-containing protein [Clostridia bacterium]|nr:protein phosphatase 2C domain-containing protein [Clostridia bacterium]